LFFFPKLGLFFSPPFTSAIWMRPGLIYAQLIAVSPLIIFFFHRSAFLRIAFPIRLPVPRRWDSVSRHEGLMPVALPLLLG